MEFRNHRLINSVIFSVLSIHNLTAKAVEPIPFPQDYRQWTHVKTLTLKDAHPLANPFQGIHHIYANKLALDDLNKTGENSQKK